MALEIKPKKQKRMTIVSHTFLSQDIITDILLKLPVRCLIRFKSVCKRWYSLATNPKFISTHLSHSIKNPSLLVFRSDHGQHTLCGQHDISLLRSESTTFDNDLCIPSVPDAKQFDDISLVGSCGGLVCLRLSCGSLSAFALWNPATTQFRKIENHEIDFHGQDYWLDYGAFGYNSEIDDYKLVTFMYFDDLVNGYDDDFDDVVEMVDNIDEGTNGVLHAGVFSWRSGSWRVLGDASLPHGYYGVDSVCINGELYWKGSTGYHRNICFILAFDMANGVFRKIDLPYPDWKFPGFTCKISSFQDSLAFIVLSEGPAVAECEQIDLWVMNKSWEKMFTIRESFLRFTSHTVWIWEGKIVIMKRRKGYDQNGFFLCDPTDPSIQATKFVGMPEPQYSYVYFYNYVESLVSVYGDKQCH